MVFNRSKSKLFYITSVLIILLVILVTVFWGISIYMNFKCNKEMKKEIKSILDQKKDNSKPNLLDSTEIALDAAINFGFILIDKKVDNDGKIIASLKQHNNKMSKLRLQIAYNTSNNFFTAIEKANEDSVIIDISKSDHEKIKKPWKTESKWYTALGKMVCINLADDLEDLFKSVIHYIKCLFDEKSGVNKVAIVIEFDHLVFIYQVSDKKKADEKKENYTNQLKKVYFMDILDELNKENKENKYDGIDLMQYIFSTFIVKPELLNDKEAQKPVVE